MCFWSRSARLPCYRVCDATSWRTRHRIATRKLDFVLPHHQLRYAALLQPGVGWSNQRSSSHTKPRTLAWEKQLNLQEPYGPKSSAAASRWCVYLHVEALAVIGSGIRTLALASGSGSQLSSRRPAPLAGTQLIYCRGGNYRRTPLFPYAFSNLLSSGCQCRYFATRSPP